MQIVFVIFNIKPLYLSSVFLLTIVTTGNRENINLNILLSFRVTKHTSGYL